MLNKPYILTADCMSGKTCKVSMTGHAILMCPNCYRLYKVATDGYINVEANNNDKIQDIIVRPIIRAECCCGFFGDMVVLDDLIAGAVSVLNQLGYKTAMSCCSHEGEYDNRLFIKFEEKQSFEDLPEGWSQSEDCLFIESRFPREQALNMLYAWLYTLSK